MKIVCHDIDIFELQTDWHICIVDYFFQSKRAAILLTSCKSQNFKIRRKAGYRIRVMRIKHKSQSVPAMHEDDLRASKFIVTPLRWLFDEFRTPDKRTEGRTDDLKTQCLHPFGRGIKYCYCDCYCFLHYMYLHTFYFAQKAQRCKKNSKHLVSWTERSSLHSISRCCLSKSRNHAKFLQKLTLEQIKVIQGHRSWCQSKAHMRLPISHL